MKQGIKNIIFDLGGVLLNIDYNKTAEAFRKIGYLNFDQMFSQYRASPLFEALETGKISENEFLECMARLSTLPVTPDAIIGAWNAMMLDFRAESLLTLETLSKKYRLYLLSNTNSIHLSRFRKIFTRDTGKPILDDYFSRTWYSHEIGLRKPHREIYEYVLQQAIMMPHETFFIDDSINNIETARALGIMTHLLLPGEKIEQLGL